MSADELGSHSLIESRNVSSDMMVIQASSTTSTEEAAGQPSFANDEPCTVQPESNEEHLSSNEDHPIVKLEDQCPKQEISLSASNHEVTRALLQRKQPLMELVSSEEGYVRRLKLVKDFYIPAVSAPSTAPSGVDNNPSGTVGSITHSDSQNPPPVAPEDLAARWRIVWGNWIQLYEWHSAFLEKLVSLVDSDPDRIPKLFIDSRARLRSIYSKYCENHRKAALIAEQYRDFFEELRIYIGDKEDVVSHLMQPVQRIMRYQLPIAEILKYTQRACSPDLMLWKKTLEIMKEIPKDTQLILEAARIDGFPGVITALGNILLRSDLLVATTTREQLLEMVSAYKMSLQNSASGTAPETSTAPNKIPPQVGRSAVNSGISSSSMDTSNIPNSSSVTANNLALQSPVEAPSSTAFEGSGLFTGNFKFVESRLFLFEQMLLVTEEVKPKRRVTTSDAFAQSTYQFKAAINVNKMRYEAHWYNCCLSSGHVNSDAATVDHLLCGAYSPDDLRFAILDQTPGKDIVYVIDPVTCSNREAWVVQLRDIQHMQHEFLLALQDPRRFNTGCRDEGWAKDALPHDPLSALNTDHSLRTDAQLSITASANSQVNQQRQRKWPSFTMKRPVRLGSNSSTVNTKETPVGGKPIPRPNIVTKSESQDRPNCLARSLSAERQPSNRDKLVDPKFNTCDERTNDDVCEASVYRKSSQSANSSIKLTNQSLSPKLSETASPSEISQHPKGGLLKKRNAFVNFFSRGKPKQRSKHQSQHQLTVPSGLQSGSEEHETAVGDCSYPTTVDDRICEPDMNLGDSGSSGGGVGGASISTDAQDVKSQPVEYTTE